MSNDSLYQKIQPIKISTTPFNISNFQFNTFECMSGSNIINLPNYVAPGTSFTIINSDTLGSKTIYNGITIFTTLTSGQSIIIIADITSNSWIISSTSGGGSIPSSVNSIYKNIEPISISTTPYTLTSEILAQNNLFYCIGNASVINLPPAILGFTFAIQNQLPKVITINNLSLTTLNPYQKINILGPTDTGSWLTCDSSTINTTIPSFRINGTTGTQTSAIIGDTFPFNLTQPLGTINGNYFFNAVLTINATQSTEAGTLMNPCCIPTDGSLGAEINFTGDVNSNFAVTITANSNSRLTVTVDRSNIGALTNWRVDIYNIN